jgi:hypothetical protein
VDQNIIEAEYMIKKIIKYLEIFGLNLIGHNPAIWRTGFDS